MKLKNKKDPQNLQHLDGRNQLLLSDQFYKIVQTTIGVDGSGTDKNSVPKKLHISLGQESNGHKATI